MAFSLKIEIHEDQEEEEDDIKYGPPASRSITTEACNYKALPRGLKDEKPLIGPRSSTGNIQILYPAQIDGFKVDHNELAKMDALGLPTGFSFGNMDQLDPRQTRGVKKTYYCNTCMIELNSEDTMVSHMKGVKHMKKQLALEEKMRNLGQPMVKQAIVPIRNPEPTKKKVPIRLQDKISESSNPVVGLDFIKEFIAVSDSEMEPHYECTICDSQGQANGIFSHLNGQKHRQEFVNRKYGVDHNTVRMSQAELLKMAYENNENQAGFSERIRTRYSDEEYTWPAGKEPWSVLRGGTGIVPDAARKNYGKKQEGTLSSPALPAKKKVEMKPMPGGSGARSPDQHHGPILPSSESIKPPKNLLDCEKMMELGQHLLLMAADYPASRLKHKDRAVLRSCFAAVDMKMKLGGKKRARTRSPSRMTSYLPGSGSTSRTRSPSSAGSSSSYRVTERSPPSRRRRTRSPRSAGNSSYRGRGISPVGKRERENESGRRRERSYGYREEEGQGRRDFHEGDYREGSSSRVRRSRENLGYDGGRGYHDGGHRDRRDSWSSTDSYQEEHGYREGSRWR